MRTKFAYALAGFSFEIPTLCAVAFLLGKESPTFVAAYLFGGVLELGPCMATTAIVLAHCWKGEIALHDRSQCTGLATVALLLSGMAAVICLFCVLFMPPMGFD